MILTNSTLLYSMSNNLFLISSENYVIISENLILVCINITGKFNQLSLYLRGNFIVWGRWDSIQIFFNYNHDIIVLRNAIVFLTMS